MEAVGSGDVHSALVATRPAHLARQSQLRPPFPADGTNLLHPLGTMVRYSREPQNDVKCTFVRRALSLLSPPPYVVVSASSAPPGRDGGVDARAGGASGCGAGQVLRWIFARGTAGYARAWSALLSRLCDGTGGSQRLCDCTTGAVRRSLSARGCLRSAVRHGSVAVIVLSFGV